jgi:large subunit ribosomal protein L10
LLKKQEKGKEKIRVKKAVSEGQAVPFEQALKMPSRSEAIGQVLALLLSPGARLAGQLRGPGGLVAGQIKTISEKKVDSGTTQGQPTEAPPAE